MLGTLERPAVKATRHRGRASPWLVTLLVAVLTAFFLLPLYWMFVTSVLPTNVVVSRTPPLSPFTGNANLNAYRDAVQGTALFTWFTNTIIVTVITVAFASVVASLAGYSLSRFRTAGHQAMGFALLLSRMLPGSLLVIPIYILLSRLKLIDTYTGLVLANTAAIVPLATWMMKTFFDSIPRELEEAAMIDGCSELGALTRVILPLARPGLASAAIYASILSWSNFVFAKTLVDQPSHWLLTMGLSSFIGEYLVQWPQMMAAGILSLIPILILFAVLEPYLVSGLTSGAVKN
jgi:multiple sugar transport system permease protein